MKTLAFVLVLIAAAQAVDWANVKPMHRTLLPALPYASLPRNNPRIIGGAEATVGQFPYQLGVFMDGSYFCGGSLISDTVALTAAHCVQGFSSWEVNAGAHDIRANNEPGRVTVTTRDAVAHEEYGPVFIINDIAIINLGQSVSGPNIASVRLPSRSMVGNDLVGETCRVSGWGKISDNAPGITDILRFVDLDVITNTECESYYGSISVRPTVICVGTNGGSVSTCNGDSGGPLVWNEADGTPTEVGIVSFGSSAGCESGAPAAFTRTTEFLDWIESNAGVTIRP